MTTVFPVTDQTATAVLWQAMASNIDRGATDPLSGFVDTDQDSVRLQYYGNTNTLTTSSDSDNEQIFDVDVDLGEAWYYEGWFVIDEVDNADPGDNLDLEITPPTGVKMYGLVYGPDQGNDTQIQFNNILLSGSLGTYRICSRTGIEDLIVGSLCHVCFVVYGDTGGGNITLDVVKNADAHANNFQVSSRYLLGRRIY